jgi:zinc protease
MINSWKRVGIAAALGIVLSGCAAAARTAPPAGGPPTLVRESLPNGLTLVIQDHRSADVVAVYLWVGTGVRYEKLDGLGFAHFQEHMLFKGTDTFGPGVIDRTIEGQGGRSNGFTSFDYTIFQIQVPSDGTRKALDLLEAMAFRSTFDP